MWGDWGSLRLLLTIAVFSPGRGLAGFLQGKLRWHIRAKMMCLFGCRGKLRIKWILKRVQLSSFNGQPNTPVFCLFKLIQNMISKNWKSLISLPLFSLVPCTWLRLVYALLLNGKHLLDQVGTLCKGPFRFRFRLFIPCGLYWRWNSWCIMAQRKLDFLFCP